MAKGHNLLGKFRGKVGATVFRTEAGIGQIASEYNPNPKNPRTLAQTKQRSKMNLAGLISSFVPYAAIAGLDSNGRKARARFVSHILKNATVSGTGTSDDPFKANVTPGALTFSEGEQTDLIFTDPIWVGRTATVTISRTNATSNTAQVMGIVMVSKGGKLVELAMSSMDIPASGAISPMQVGFTTDYDEEPDLNIEVYVVPILNNEGSARALYDAEVDWVNSAYSVSVARSLASVSAYGDSKYVGNADYQE